MSNTEQQPYDLKTLVGTAIMNAPSRWSACLAAQKVIEQYRPAGMPPTGDFVLAELDALQDDAAVHIFPDDLEKCGKSECTVEVYSVRAGTLSGKNTVPLFSREQVVEALKAAHATRPPGDAREAGDSFLLLPQRPKPEWPATIEFPHDRYSGVQMLTFGRHCADLGATSQASEQPPIVAEILAELDRATRKFPTWPTDPLHALAVLGEEFGETTKAMLQLTYEPHKTSAAEVRTEAIQTAAMALRLAMSLDRYEYRRGDQHSQQERAAA